jgi:WD40 repeat protein
VTLAAPSLAPVAECPFPGLRSFTEEQSHLFFGRDDESDALIHKLSESKFAAVVGTSGSGKSSLVRAGLLPSLHGGYFGSAGSSWVVADFRPGSTPLETFAAALHGVNVGTLEENIERMRASSFGVDAIVRQALQSGSWPCDARGRSNLLILVDQFEELFRYPVRPDSEMKARDGKKRFVKLLIESLRDRDLPVYVLLTMRSEYLGDCSEFRGLPELISGSQYLIPRMTRSQLRETIVGPVYATNAQITPRLVQRLLNDAGDDVDQLPLMQHALQRTWYRWHKSSDTNTPIDLTHYDAEGGIAFALSNDADHAYKEACTALPDDGDRIIKHVFQRLRDRDERGRETRRPTKFSELCFVAGVKDPISHDELLTAIGPFLGAPRHFLTAVLPDADIDDLSKIDDDTEIDITHECLLRKWTKLTGDMVEDARGGRVRKGWIAEEDESRRIYQRLLEHVRENPWKPDVLTGTKFQIANDWWHERRPNVSWAARYHADSATFGQEFHAVEKLLDRSRAAIEQQRVREEQARRAREENELNEKKRQLEADLREIYAWRQRLALIVGFLLALVGIAFGGMSLYNKQVAVQEENTQVKASRDLALVRQIGADARLALQEGPARLHTGVLLAAESVERGRESGNTPLESRLALIASLTLLPKPLHVLKQASPESVTSPLAGPWVATASIGDITLWNSTDGNQRRRWEADHPGGQMLLTVSADGRFIASLAQSGRLRVWDTGSGQQLGELSCVRGAGWQRPRAPGRLAFAPDGRTLLAACDGIRRWDRVNWKRARAGERLAWPALETLEPISALAFNADGTRLVVGGKDVAGAEEHVLILDAASGREIHRKRLTASDLTSVMFIGDRNDRVAASDESGNIRVWTVTAEVTTEPLTAEPLPTTPRPNRLLAPQPILSFPGRVNSIAFTRDGGRVVAAVGDGTARVFETRYWREIARLVHDHSVSTAMFVRDDTQILTVPASGTPRFWALPALGEITTLPASLGSAPDAAIALGDSEILVRGANRLPDLLRWDGRSLGQLRARWRKGLLVIERIEPPRNGQPDANASLAGAQPAAAAAPAAAAINTGEAFTIAAASVDGARLFVMVRLAQGRGAAQRALIGLKREGTGYAEIWRRPIDGIVVFKASPSGEMLAARIIPESRAPAPGSSQPPAADASLVVFDGRNGKELARKPLEAAESGAAAAIPPTLIAVSPTDEVIYQNREGVINVWRHVSNIDRDITLTNGGAVSACAFSPNGRVLAIATGPAAEAIADQQRRGDAAIEIIPWPNGEWRLKWPLGAAVTRLAFSGGGKYLAAGGREETVRIWDISRGLDDPAKGREYEVARVESTRPVSFFAFSTGDKRIITLDSRHFVSHVWQDGDLLHEACARVTRNLLPSEWEKYVPNVPYHETCATPPQ